MPPRAEKKLHTRQALLAGALKLMETGRGFCSLSLREVTREAGIVPAGFYRHFNNMDELGVSLVEACSSTFRQAIRDVRRNQLELGGAIDASVRIFIDAVAANREQFLFIAREQFGGSTEVRNAIAELGRQVSIDLAQDLAQMPRLKHLSAIDYDIFAGLVVKTVFSTLADLVNQPAGPLPPELDPRARLTHKLRFLMIGVKHWRGIGPGETDSPAVL